jgi:hypothetical protein
MLVEVLKKRSSHREGLSIDPMNSRKHHLLSRMGLDTKGSKKRDEVEPLLVRQSLNEPYLQQIVAWHNHHNSIF